MASDNEASCISDPNFAVICSFLECFGKSCGIDYPDIAALQKMLENTHEVPQPLVDLHIKLLRKTRKSVSTEKWERALVKFGHTYSNQDGWELERFGYKKARIGVKLRLLKVLLESQFDLNQKFKNEVNKLAAKELRVEPLGRDKTGLAYWFQLDEGCNIRVYREDLDEESWELVANNREGVVNLINTLSDGEIGPIPINEDSNSLEISEKPIIDTGQVSTSSPSVEEDGGIGVRENGVADDSKNEIQLNNKNINNVDVQKSTSKKIFNKITDESDNSDEESEDIDEEDEEAEEEEEEEEEEDEELSNDDEDETLKQNTEEENEEDEVSQDTEVNNDTISVTAAATPVISKASVNQLKNPIRCEDYAKHKAVAHELVNVEKEIIKTSVIKPNIAESIPLKSIETPVITTSPLKLVNITELKQTTSDRISDMTMTQPISIIKSTSIEESMSLSVKKHEKLPMKNSLSFADLKTCHSKIPIKPIDQLAANLVRMQSEKLEKPSASKLLEKIAENLARSNSAHGSSVINGGDDDKFLSSDFSARNQPDKLNLISNVRTSRGIDLSTSPRGWESVNDYNRPMDFSGIDLSSRKTTSMSKLADLPSHGYSSQEFQYREIDLSTRKITKTEIPNLPYDSRTALLRNHTMVTDLSKRQIPFVNYDMPSVAAAAAAAAYRSSARIPGKEEHRLANYTILPDPSKLASMRSSAVKRPLDSIDVPQQEMMKRIRAELMPMSGVIDKKSTMVGGMRRNDVGPAIEEPLMMVHGEGSGSDCDAGNAGVGEAIEESVIFFYGEGNGRDCDTGNPGDETSTDNKDSNESKDEGCSEISVALTQTKVTDNDTDNDSDIQSETANITDATEKSVQLNSDCTGSNTGITTTSNFQLSIAATSESAKTKFKPSLGVQVIAKTSSGSSIKRISRWDVGGPETKRECDSSIISSDENISSELSVNDIGCQEETNKLTVNLPSAELKLETDAISSTTNQSSSKCSATSSILPQDNQVSTNSEFQCDSSSVEPVEIDSTKRENRCKSTETMEIEPSQCDETDEAPRFFFGPNCVSYTPTTHNKRNIEQDAAPSTTVHSIQLVPDENVCTSDNNNLMKDPNDSMAVSEPDLAEADKGTSEEDNYDENIPTEMSELPNESMEVSIDKRYCDSDNEEISSNLESSEAAKEMVEEEDISESEKSGQCQSTEIITTGVPESSTASSTYPEDERGKDESMKALASSDNESRDDTVTNSDCAEIEKLNIKIDEVAEAVESTSLTNEVCSTSNNSIEEQSTQMNDETIDSRNVEEALQIDSMGSTCVDEKKDSLKAESDETTPESTEVVAEKMDEFSGDLNREEQEEKVKPSIEDISLNTQIEDSLMETEHNIEDKIQTCDTSALEPIITESTSTEDSTIEALPLSDINPTIPKSSENIETLKEEEEEEKKEVSDNEESQKIIDTTNTFLEDFSDNPGDSPDQDSNEPMVIDDRTSDSSSSVKDLNTETNEECHESKNENLDSNTLETEKKIEVSSEILGSTIVSEQNVKVDEKSDMEVEKICEEKKEEMPVKTCIENILLPIERETESIVSAMTMELSEISELPTSVEASSTLSDNSSKLSLKSQTSLVANYDSNESNDTCSDDVFDVDSAIETDLQDVEQSMITENEKISQVPVEFPTEIEVAKSESTTVTENVSTIDVKIEPTLPDNDQIIDTKLESISVENISVIDTKINPACEESTSSIDIKMEPSVKDISHISAEIESALTKNVSTIEKESAATSTENISSVDASIIPASTENIPIIDMKIPPSTENILRVNVDVSTLVEDISTTDTKIEETAAENFLVDDTKIKPNFIENISITDTTIESMPAENIPIVDTIIEPVSTEDISTIDSKIEITPPENVSVVDTKIETSTENVSVVDTKIVTSTENIFDVDTKIETSIENISDFDTKIETSTENIPVVDTSIETSTKKISAIATKIETSTENICDVDTKIETTTENIPVVDTNIETNTENISVVDTKFETSTKNISAIATKIETSTESISDVDTKIETSTVNFTDVDTKIETSTVNITDVDTKIETSTVNFTDVDTKIETSTVNISDVDTNIDTGTEKSSTIEIKIDSTPAMNISNIDTEISSTVEPEIGLTLQDNIPIVDNIIEPSLENISTTDEKVESEPTKNIPSIVEPTTSTENTFDIDTKINEKLISNEITGEIDDVTLENTDKIAGVETVKDLIVEEKKPIAEFVEPIIGSLTIESKAEKLNQDPCHVDEIKTDLETNNQDQINEVVQSVSEIISEKSSISPEIVLNNLETEKSTANMSKTLSENSPGDMTISENNPENIEISENIQCENVLKNTEEMKTLLEDIPQRMTKSEETKRSSLENVSEEMAEDIAGFSSEYSGSNSPVYTDEEDDDEEPPIVQLSKRPKTDIEELNQNITDEPTCMKKFSKDSKQILNETTCDNYAVPPSVIAPMTKSDDYVKQLQIDGNPVSTTMSDSTSNVTFLKEIMKTKIEQSKAEIFPSMSLKESSDEFKSSLTVSVVTNVIDSLSQDNTDPMICVKTDVKKETSKRLHREIESEDFPPFKSKPIDIDYVKNEPQSLANDIKSVFHESPIEIMDKTFLSPSVESITTFIPSILQSEKKEIDIKCEQIHQVCSNNFTEMKPSNSEETEDTIVITDLSNAKPVGDLDESDDSMGVDNECIFGSAENNIDELSIVNDSLADEKMDLENTKAKLGVRVKSMNEIQYEGWKLDSTEPMTPMTPLPKASRKRRNSAHESNSEDGTGKQEDDLEEMTGGKRIKLRGKRTPDLTMRKLVEDSRVENVSSEDETLPVTEKTPSTPLSNPPAATEEIKLEIIETTTVDPFKPKNKGKGRRRRGFRSKRRASRHKKSDATSSVAGTPIVSADGLPIDDASESTPTARKKRKKRKMVLGLEIGIDIALPDSQSGAALDETPVRQSRRIAQIKIKEEADRRRIEEEALGEMKEKKDRDTADKKKRKKTKGDSDDDPPVKCEIRDDREVKLKKKRKKKKKEAKFNEAKPWQSSSGSSTEDENENDEDLDDEDDIESEESLLFKSDHEFSPESDLEKDTETEPMRRARTARKSENDVEEAEDEYACQKCGKADHPEWILLCDTCDKGWHCSCLRPALMLIPEGDWFCPPCQHNLLVNKLRDSLKTYDLLAKRHENEILRKKRLAFVGISLDNVLQKNDGQRQHKSSRLSSRDDDSDEDNDGDDDDDVASDGGSSSSSESSDSGSSESGSSSDESEPVYQLRERRCANTYKFNEYDDMINAAIQDEVEAVQGAGNQGRGKDISTIVNAEKDDAQVEVFDKQMEEENYEDKQSEKDSEKEFSKDADFSDNEDQHKSLSSRKLLSRKKHRKLNSLDISSEDDPDSDEDFKGSSSDEEEDYDDQLLSSDDSSFTESRRRGKKNSRPVRRSTRAARKTRYDEDFINDDSDDSDRPKRKKSKCTWDESESEESDNSWRSRKKKTRPSAVPRLRTSTKSKSKKKKKRKRIIEPDNQSDNENEDEDANVELEKKIEEIEASPEPEHIVEPIKEPVPIIEPSLSVSALPQKFSVEDESNNIVLNEEKREAEEKKEEAEEEEEEAVVVTAAVPEESFEIPAIEEPKPEFTTNYPIPTPVIIEEELEKRREHTPKIRKTPTIRRKIIYGGLPDDRPPQDEEPLGRRTRGRKINYQVDTIMSDSEEELKKALRKTEESEDEFVVHEGEDFHDDAEKDSDSGDIYSPKKDTPKGRYKSPKNRRIKKSPGGKSMTDNGEPKQRKKPGPKPGSKNKPRQTKSMMSSLEGGVIGDVAEGSLASLGTSELAELDDEQLEQMMMEDEEYGRRQLELAAIEIAKNKKKEEREAKKLEKARLKALEILAAEQQQQQQQRDPNAPEGIDGEVPKKKKRGRRSKAEILADQMRRDGAPHLGGGSLTPSPNIPTIIPPSLSIVNPALSSMPVMMMPSDAADRLPIEGQMPLITGPDGHLFNPDGTPAKPKRRGRGKGKKTLALEAARAAEAAAKAAAEAGGLGLTSADVSSELKPDDIPNVLPTPGSSTSGSAPSTPPAIAVTSQGLPPPSSQSSNPQSVYPQLPPSQQSSVITRMLQSQPVSTAPQSFTAAAAAMGQKYFGVPNAASQMMVGPRSTYDMSSRGRIPSPYSSRQPGQPPLPPHFAAVRSGTPPMRMRVPGPTQLYHTPHHPMDPSPSGGGPIAINSRDRASPLGPGQAIIPTAAGSPLAKGGRPTPPPYVRGGPPLSRFADNPQLGSRHQLPPFTSASPANHSLQQPSPPPNRPPGNFSPYHPQPPPNYHYGAYPPPTPMPTADDAAAYQGSPYSAEHFSTSAENPPPIPPPTSQSTQPQAPPPQPPPSQQQHPPPHPNEPVHGPVKQYDEEGTGEFGGLVSYFSSQREDDLDS